MLNSNTLFYLDQEQNSTIDSVSGESFQSLSGNPPLFTTSNLIDKNAIVLQNSQQLYFNNLSVNITNEFSISFYLYSNNSGVYFNQQNNQYENIVMPFFNLGNNNVVISEIANVNNMNSLQIVINDLNGNSLNLVSGQYVSSKWHHIFISYSESSSSLLLYIDGVLFSSNITVSGSYPIFSIPFNVLNIGSLKNIINYDVNYVDNTGQIADILILNNYINNLESIQNIINEGTNYLVDSDYSSYSELNIPFVFNDVSSVTYTGIQNDGMNLYISTSDARIIKGSPVFLQSRHDFQDVFESQFFLNNISNVNQNGSTIYIENGNISL